MVSVAAWAALLWTAAIMLKAAWRMIRNFRPLISAPAVLWNRKECRSKKICYVHVNQAIVADSDNLFHIDLGTCVCVILCGIGDAKKVWFGVNHLFNVIARTPKGLVDVSLDFP